LVDKSRGKEWKYF